MMCLPELGELLTHERAIFTSCCSGLAGGSGVGESGDGSVTLVASRAKGGD
jgi:hypothetical protein